MALFAGILALALQTAAAQQGPSLDQKARTTVRVGAALNVGAIVSFAGLATGTPALLFSGGVVERAALPTAAAGAMRSRTLLSEAGAELAPGGGIAAYSLYGAGSLIQAAAIPVFIGGTLRAVESGDDRSFGNGVVGAAGLLGLGLAVRWSAWAGVAAQTSANQRARSRLVADVREHRRPSWCLSPMSTERGLVLTVSGW